MLSLLPKQVQDNLDMDDNLGDDDDPSYPPKKPMTYKGEPVECVMPSSDSVMVITLQGREHLGEYNLKEETNLDDFDGPWD